MVYKKILTIMLVILFLNGCGKKPEQAANGRIVPVKTDRITLIDINDTLDYTGDIKAQDEAVIYPKVTGKIIEKVKEDGAAIKKGEVICYIDRDEVGLKFEKAPVESTLSGVLGRVYVDIGQNVSLDTAIALVVSDENVKINLDIPEKYLPRVTLAQEAQISVDSWPDKKFLGKVTKVSPVIDLATRTAPVEITVENKERLLKSGMFAKVQLVIEKREKVPVILREAIMGHEPNQYVYVVEGKKSYIRKINLGIRQGPYFEVTQGLKEGDQVVIMGQQLLTDGTIVEPEAEK